MATKIIGQGVAAPVPTTEGRPLLNTPRAVSSIRRDAVYQPAKAAL